MQYVFFQYFTGSFEQIKDKNAFWVLVTTWGFKGNFIIEFFHFMRNKTLWIYLLSHVEHSTCQFNNRRLRFIILFSGILRTMTHPSKLYARKANLKWARHSKSHWQICTSRSWIPSAAAAAGALKFNVLCQNRRKRRKFFFPGRENGDNHIL